MGPIALRLLLPLLGAAGFRIRGGWLGLRGFVARALWAVPTGLLVASVLGMDVFTRAAWLNYGAPGITYVWPMVVVTLTGVLASWAGLWLPNAGFQDMGRDPRSGTLEHDLWLAAAIGVARTALLVGCIFAWSGDYGTLPWIALGALNAPIYLACYHIPVPEGWELDNRKPVDWPTAWAELAWGLLEWTIILNCYAGGR